MNQEAYADCNLELKHAKLCEQHNSVSKPGSSVTTRRINDALQVFSLGVMQSVFLGTYFVQVMILRKLRPDLESLKYCLIIQFLGSLF